MFLVSLKENQRGDCTYLRYFLGETQHSTVFFSLGLTIAELFVYLSVLSWIDGQGHLTVLPQ